LIVVGGDAQSRQFELHLPAVIGRSRRTDVRLGHPLVSRQHCEVFEADGLLMVRDLGSLNGTFVGDTRIAEQAMPVKPGELLTVGPVTFRAEYLAAAEGHGKSSTWDTEGPTRDDPLPHENGHPHDELADDFEGPLFRDDDDETARPGQ
jgi:predicted component of type VI protein secretion system